MVFLQHKGANGQEMNYTSSTFGYGLPPSPKPQCRPSNLRKLHRGRVLTVPNRLLRNVFEWRVSAPVRFLYWLYFAFRDQMASKRSAGLLGGQVLNIYSDTIFSNPNRDTVFILAGGSSVNELTPDRLNLMRGFNSVGVNFWFLHEFIPTLYCLDSGRPRSKTPQEQEAARLVESRLGREEILSADPPILLLRPHGSSWDSVMAIPDDLKKNVLLGGRANSVTRQRANLRLDLALLSLAVRHRAIPPAVLPDNGASVVRLIFLAIAQRFKNIVLVGVDLDERPHFFASPAYGDIQGPIAKLFPRRPGQQHGTTSTEDRPFNTVDVILDLAKVVENLDLGKIWVGSSTSALAESLPVYQWDNRLAHRDDDR